MININIVYVKKQIKKHLSEVGFISSKRNMFYRIVTDVIQRIEFDFVESQWCYRIKFDLVPFCSGISIKSIYSTGASYGIRLLTGKNDDMPLSHSENNVISDIVLNIETFILPFFDECTDSVTGYRALLRKQNEYKLSIENPNKNFFDFDMFWLAVKSEDYLVAKSVVDEFVEQSTNAFEHNVKHYKSNDDIQKCIEKYNKKMQKWNFYLELLMKKQEQLDALVLKNEELTRNSLNE